MRSLTPSRCPEGKFRRPKALSRAPGAGDVPPKMRVVLSEWIGRRSDAGDVGGEEVDAVAVEVAAGAVVVLGGAWVGVASEYLYVSQGNSGVEGVGDRSVAQGVRADVSRDAGGLGDPEHHPVDVASVDRLAGGWPQDQRPVVALSAAGLEDPEHRYGERHGGGLAALANQVQDAVSPQGVGVVLRSGRRRPRRRGAR